MIRHDQAVYLERKRDCVYLHCDVQGKTFTHAFDVQCHVDDLIRRMKALLATDPVTGI